MSEGSFLQQLMTEQLYRSQNAENQESKANIGHSPYNISRQQNIEVSVMTKDNSFPAPSAPRRALSDDSPVSQAHPFLKSSSRSAEASAPQFAPCPPPRKSETGANPRQTTRPFLSQTSGLISRLRQEFLNKPAPNLTQLPPKNTQQITVLEPTELCHTPGSGVATPTGNGSNYNHSPSSDKYRLHGHPKSNSAGEEFLYTDRKAKLAANKNHRRHRGKANVSVVRSRSLHYSGDHSPQLIVERRATDLGLGTEPFMGGAIGAVGNTPRKKSDTSTLSSGSFASDNKSSSSSSNENYFQIPTAVENSQAALAHIANNPSNTSDPSSTQYQHTNNLNLSSMVLTPSGMGGLPQQSMTPTGPHGPYYATVPTNPVSHHPLGPRHSPPPHQQVPPAQQQIQQTASPPRGPPPPYPQGATYTEDVSQPQRPNSLSLSGQISRKKMEYGSAQNSPALTSPAMSSNPHPMNFSYAMSAGTPVHGTSFLTQDIAASTNTTTNGSNNSVLHGYQQPTTQPKFTRSGSGGRNGVGYHQMAQQADIQAYNSGSTSTSSSSSTVVGTPGSQQRFDSVPAMRPQTHQQQYTATQQQASTSPSYGQHFVPQPVPSSYNEFSASGGPSYPNAAGNSSGYSLGKSDSVNSNASTSSSGSRIARRAKRNSKNYSNTSGSSSSTGNSRPNSSADVLDRIMNDYENLRTQLQTANQKLNKFQNIEKEFLRIKDDYQALHTSASKSEKMEEDLRASLEATNRRTQQENDILRERIKTLSELVETLQSSNKDVQTTSNSDIMMYKVKVKEYQTHERMLNEQLDESNDKIAEQQADISLLSSSLEKTQTTISSLKERLLEKQKVDQYVEELSPMLDSLLSTVQTRLRVETELGKIVKSNQRKSTSSNDEGISEMDSSEVGHPLSPPTSQSTSTETRDEQLYRMQAQMLKWQHMYLEATLLRELSLSTGESSTSSTSQQTTAPLYNMLYRHRHAASDPSSNKGPFVGRPSWNLSALNTLFDQSGVHLRLEQRREGDVKRRPAGQRREKSAGDQNRSPRRRRRETTPSCNEKHGCPSTSRESFSESEKNTENIREKEKDSDNVKSNTKKKTDSEDTTANIINATGSTSSEFDSPSEGYHSQQSSGSPTPSSERSSLHFPEGDSRVTAALQGAECSTSPQANSQTSRQTTTPTTNSGLYILGTSSGAGKTVLTKVADV